MVSGVAKHLAEFEEACRQRGLRLTPQRMEIYKALLKAQDHPTAELLHQRLLKTMPTLSLDTVYRTLGTFVEMGVATRVETVESQARFEARHLAHHHLICRRCDKIMDFEWPVIDAITLPDIASEWGEVERKSIVLYGICNDCADKDS